MSRFSLICAVACALVLTVAADARAETAVCVGALTGVFDNVVVPPGAECQLSNSIVHRNILVLNGATLDSSRNAIGGDVRANRPEVLFSSSDRIGGSLEVTRASQSVGLIHGEIGGDIVVRGSVASITLLRSFVGGNVIVHDNVIVGQLRLSRIVASGSLQVDRNSGPAPKTVDGNFAALVSCFDNDLPFIGGPNVAPQREGQCF